MLQDRCESSNASMSVLSPTANVLHRRPRNPAHATRDTRLGGIVDHCRPRLLHAVAHVAGRDYYPLVLEFESSLTQPLYTRG
jgi:hypothetical protein